MILKFIINGLCLAATMISLKKLTLVPLDQIFMQNCLEVQYELDE